MVIASDLKPGVALSIQDQIYKVIEVDSRAGTAKMGGTVHVRLSNVRSGNLWDHSFRPLQRLETVDLEKRSVEFLFSDGVFCTFQRLDTYEQIEIPAVSLGLAAKYLQPGTELPAEFFEHELVGVELPGTLEAQVKSTAPPLRSQQDSGRKEATLDNGLTIQVPLFVAPGEWVSVDLKTGRYVERVRTPQKKSA
ncbi:MAG TPA: hypothetical protein VF730_10845 [Terracidiphilus sp.]